MMRVTSDIWVRALLRRVFADGGYGAIERHGAAQAGAIFVRVRDRTGTETLISPAPQSYFDDERPDERAFERRLTAVSREEVDALLVREVGFDSDLWVVEIETDEPGAYIALTPAS